MCFSSNAACGDDCGSRRRHRQFSSGGLGDRSGPLSLAVGALHTSGLFADVLGSAGVKEKIKITNYYSTHVFNLKPVTTVRISIDGEEYEATSTGDGQYDAFMKAIHSIYKGLNKELPTLVNYKISIPPGGRTDALVETIVTWQKGDEEFRTRGLESDQQAAAITATIKMLNILEG